jgi:ArsR family transcriptional regulator
MKDAARLAALANGSHLAVLRWLKDPTRHFPRQQHADIERTGVCCTFISAKLGIAAATTSRHMKLLADAGFVQATRLGKFTYYRRVDAQLRAFGRDIAKI